MHPVWILTKGWLQTSTGMGVPEEAMRIKFNTRRLFYNWKACGLCKSDVPNCIGQSCKRCRRVFQKFVIFWGEEVDKRGIIVEVSATTQHILATAARN